MMVGRAATRIPVKRIEIPVKTMPAAAFIVALLVSGAAMTSPGVHGVGRVLSCKAANFCGGNRRCSPHHRIDPASFVGGVGRGRKMPLLHLRGGCGPEGGTDDDEESVEDRGDMRDDIENFRAKFLEMFAGNIEDGEAQEDDGERQGVEGSVGGWINLGENGEADLKSVIREDGPGNPDGERYLNMFNNALLNDGVPLDTDEVVEEDDGEGGKMTTRRIMIDSRFLNDPRLMTVPPPPPRPHPSGATSGSTPTLPQPENAPPPPPLPPQFARPKLNALQGPEAPTTRRCRVRGREHDTGDPDCKRCKREEDKHLDAPRPDQFDPRFDSYVPGDFGSFLEGMLGLRERGRLVISERTGGHAWEMPIVVSQDEVEYADYHGYIQRMTESISRNETTVDEWQHPDSLCPVSPVVMGRIPLRVYGVVSTEDGYLSKFNEGTGVRFWGNLWLEVGSCGSFTSVHLGFNKTGGSLLPRLVEEILQKKGNGSGSEEGFRQWLRGFGKDMLDFEEGEAWEHSLKCLQDIKRDTDGFTDEPCVKIWDGPWLFSQSSVQCASGIAVSLGHVADLMGERCTFGGLGRGVYDYYNGLKIGKRHLEASCAFELMHDASCKLHDCRLENTHDTAIQATMDSLVEMARCTVNGSRHGLSLSENAKVKACNCSLVGLTGGAMNPVGCENATLSIEKCVLKARMWANEAHARSYISKRHLALQGRANVFLPMKQLPRDDGSDPTGGGGPLVTANMPHTVGGD